MIKFLCPNGHQLSAPENLAGKAGKCPKCNTAFLVPEPDSEDEAERGPPSGETGEEPAAASEAGEAEPTGDDSQKPATPAMGSGKGKALTGEVFVFLCPNGHKLNGPPSLKGKAGQCPHCGARFRIPADDDLELPEEEPADEASDDAPAEQSGEAGMFDFAKLMGGEEAEEEQEYGEEEYSEEAVEDASVAPPPPGPSGLGYIVGRLWEQRTEGSELEIFLNEGEIVAPDEFSEILSSSDYGVFAIQEGDGSYAVTVIPWSAVRRIGMRKLDDLPEQLF